MKATYAGKTLSYVKTDRAAITQGLRALPREADLAMIRGMNTAANRIARSISRDLSLALKITPQKIIRKRIKVFRANMNHLWVTIGVTTNGVPAISLAGIRDTGQDKITGKRRMSNGRNGLRFQIGDGVRATGGHHWPHAWIGKGSGGKQQVFERVGKARTPIAAVRVNIHDAAKVLIEKYGQQLLPMALELGHRDLTFRVNRRLGIA